MEPFTIAAIASAGGNLLSNLFAPRKSQLTAGDVREALMAQYKAGMNGINAGVADANRGAAAQAAQSGINTPNYLARMIGLNELGGAQAGAQLRGQMAGNELNALGGIANTNLQAGQQYAQGIGNTLGYIADPLAQMATLQYMVNNPQMLSMIRGEV